MGQVLGIASEDQGLVILSDRIYTITGKTKWSAVVTAAAYSLADAAQRVEISIRCNDKQRAVRTFFVGTALETSRHSFVGDVEKWVIAHCGSRDIKWGLLQLVVTETARFAKWEVAQC